MKKMQGASSSRKDVTDILIHPGLGTRPFAFFAPEYWDPKAEGSVPNT